MGWTDGTITSRFINGMAAPPLDKGNKDSGNEIAYKWDGQTGLFRQQKNTTHSGNSSHHDIFIWIQFTSTFKILSLKI